MAQTSPEETPGSSLTVGLEVESFAALRSRTFSFTPADSLAELLAMRVRTLPLYGPDGNGAAIEVVDNSGQPPSGGLQLDYGSWNFTEDPVVQATHPEWFIQFYETQPIEIISPTYWFTTYFWEQDIQKMFSSGTYQYNAIWANDIRLFHEFNGSTRFHVHIGNGTGVGSQFPFETVRNLAMILLVYEPELDRLLLRNKYSNSRVVPPRIISPKECPHFRPPNVPHEAPRSALATHLLNTCPNINSVINAMNPPIASTLGPNARDYFKYNFTSLLDSLNAPPVPDGQSPQDGDATPTPPSYRPKRKAPTIQFRHQNDTMDGDVFVHSIRFLSSLVYFAGEIDLESLREFLGLNTNMGGNGLSSFQQNSTSNNNNNNTNNRNSTYSMLSGATSASGHLYGIYPLGSLDRLLSALEFSGVPIDHETSRFWRRRAQSFPNS
ncbi:hypothetical protein AJ80_01587 [Polytolypa hystricis UAMH7299]|uniref:Uncharacterized protein n=1 Tax=Polytolypa hystricis (strain UAMH7299) TaxID=1447883 RepID=A0A2B7Z0N6_POLH7|nr:hypothetical protein AJ80_01587 [Polytolypa hystricis UAMH7299]